jgi:cell division protein DivIC
LQRILLLSVSTKETGYMKKKKKLIFWLLIAVFFGSIFVRQQVMISRIRKDYLAHEDQLNKLRLQNSQLKEQKKQAQKPDYIEKLAREKLRLVKPGEVLFIDQNKPK